MRSPRGRAAVGLATAALLVSAALSASPATATAKHHHHSDDPVVVASHLNNPRQLAVGPHGTLLVALAGAGGTSCSGTGEDENCVGNTAGIDKIRAPWSSSPSVRSVVSGQPSAAAPDASFAVGTNGVGAGRDGRVYGVNSAGQGDPTSVAGTLFVVKHGHTKVVADLAAYENSSDPDGQGPDSDVYSVLVQKHRILVADAAGNDVLSVDRRGHISTLHVFPNITTGPCASQPPEAPGRDPGCDFVPTALAEGPHGTIFVTGLAAEVPGEGRVVQLSRHGKLLHEWSGFTTPVGIVACGGGFYVSELFANLDEANPDPPNVGQVTKVRWNGSRSSRLVPLPAGLAIIGHNLYVSAYSISPADGLFGNPDWNGQIWRLKL